MDKNNEVHHNQAARELGKEAGVKISESNILSEEPLKFSERLFPTVEEFLYTVPILQFEEYLTDAGRNEKDWSADGIAHFSALLGVKTSALTAEILMGEKSEEGIQYSEWKVAATAEYIDTGYTEMSIITQPRQIEKTNYETKEKYEEDDDFSLEKATARAIRNAKKRAIPAKKLLSMLYAARKARDDARNEVRARMGYYKELGFTPRDLVAFTEARFASEEPKNLSQDYWQERHWLAFKTGLADGVEAKQGLFRELFLSERSVTINAYDETSEESDSSAEINNPLPEENDEAENEADNAESESEPEASQGKQASIPSDYGE